VGKTAEDVLRECHIKRPPVPVEEIPAHYGIQVCELRGSSDIFGAILRGSDRVVIAINPTQHPNRQRFTFAHELGHYFCHPNDAEHVDRDFRISWRRTDSPKGINWKEVEANRWAAALLMPEEFLRRDLDLLELDRIAQFEEALIRQLASRYRVSPPAMKLRLFHMGVLLSPELNVSGT